MTPPEVYQVYLAIKTHFLSASYDCFHYNFKTTATIDSFDARHDLVHFRKVANFYDPIGLLVSHLVNDPSKWIGDIARNEKPYRERKKIIDTLTRTFTAEIKTLSLPQDLEVAPNQHPIVLQKWLGGKISLETLTILCDLSNCDQKWLQVYRDDPLMIGVRRVRKYIPFLKMLSVYDPETFRKLLTF
jgi:hypothetical protein